MEVLRTDRQEGKTTKLMEWVMGGEKIHRYPGWNRVAVVVNRQMRDEVRDKWWYRIEDLDHRVFYWQEIVGNRNFWNQDVEARIDNMDLIMMGLIPGVRVTGFTMTGESWE